MDDAAPKPAIPAIPYPASTASSTHRLPTLTAAQALAAQRAEDDVGMGVEGLDALMRVRRGEVTEIYGPPGVGKRAFGLQFVVAALKREERVVWIDAGTPLPGQRLQTVLAASLTNPNPTSQQPASSLLQNLTIFTPPTLPHLLALLSTPLPRNNTPTLLILSSPSSLLPPPQLHKTSTTQPRPRRPGPGHAPAPPIPTIPPSTPLIASLTRLAATSHIALLVLSHAVTQLQHNAPAALVPAIGSPAWEVGVAGRVVLWWERGERGRGGRRRFAKVVRRGGRRVDGGVVGFVVSKEGVRDAPPPPPPPPQPPAAPGSDARGTRKRKADETETLDADGVVDEEYGWDERDEVGLPLLGPQTQGSEDILVVPEEETETEGEDDDDDDEEKERGSSPGG